MRQVKIPEPFLRRTGGGGYATGWLTKGGSLRSVEWHSAFKAWGYRKANEAHKAQQRFPRDLSTYGYAWDQGCLRLEVKATEVRCEYNVKRTAGGGYRPPLHEVLTPAQARALHALAEAKGARITIYGYDHNDRPIHHSIHPATPADILQEVHNAQA